MKVDSSPAALMWLRTTDYSGQTLALHLRRPLVSFLRVLAVLSLPTISDPHVEVLDTTNQNMGDTARDGTKP